MKAVRIAAVSALLAAASAAHAAPVAVVNLCAGSTSPQFGAPVTALCPNGPNAGTHSGSATPNPITISLAAGGYSVNVVGTTTTGALFNAYTISGSGNGNFTDDGWSFTANGVTQGHVGQSAPTFATAAASLAAYSIGGSNALYYTFYLPTAQTVQFQLDDSNTPFFTDDSGGVSLAINQAVPEPMTVSLFGMGLVALGVSRRRRAAQA